MWGAGRSSGGRAHCCEGLDPPAWRIDPAWWMYLQFGLFSAPTSGLRTGPSKAVVCAVPSAGTCIYKIPCCLLEIVAYVMTAGFL